MTPTTRLTSRPYAGRTDLLGMRSMLLAHPNLHEQFPTAADLEEFLDPAASDNPESTLVWEDAEGEIAAFAIMQARYGNLYFHLRPNLDSDQIEREMMPWAAARIRRAAGGGGQPPTLDSPARDEDTARAALLERNGFAPGDDRTLSMARSLREPFPSPHLPPGFTPRPLAGEGEVGAYVATHRAAFGTENMTVEQRLAILRGPRYRPELDLVAVAPDGTLAAFCVCGIDDAGNERTGRKEGEIDIVGVHPDFQRRGLGRAMVLAGMRALGGQGMDVAALGVASDNRGAIRLYESAGFRTRWSVRWYSKRVE